MDRSNLHKYQERAVDFIINNKGAALFLDMGLGKSVITLTALSELIDNVEVNRVLIVAPKKVAESTWVQEVAKWEHLRYLRTSVILGNVKQRQKALQKEADIYVTSRDMFAWVAEQGFTFDTLVLDELTSFKSSKAKRFKCLKRLRPRLNRVIGLTGTPTPNGFKDLWAQMYCIDMGTSLGRSKQRFIDAFFNTFSRQGVMIKCDLKEGAEKDIYKLISNVTLTMKADDYLELPPLIEHTVCVPPSQSFRDRYNEFEREKVLEYRDILQEQSQSIIAANAAVLCNKLCQVANGAIYNEERQVVWLHDEKLEMLLELIEQAQDQHVLVFYQFQHDCTRIMDAIKGKRVRKYEGDADLVAWNNGEIDVLLTHAASTAYGLNLQHGGHVIIWYGTGWNAELYLQGNARLHRQGQQQPTIVYRLVMDGTMDVTAMKAVDSKVSSQDAMLNALKNKIKLYA